MPVGYAPAYTGFRGITSIPSATSLGSVRAGAAVAMTNDGVSARLEECSSTYHGDRFLGFATVSALDGGALSVIVTRGSNVTPIVKDGLSLVPNGRVYLSSVLGEVTQVPPALGAPSTLIQVGTAVTETDLILITDARVVISG